MVTPRVLLSAAHFKRQLNDLTLISVVRDTYLQKCARHSLLPIIISPAFSREQQEELYRETSGVIFTGGADIDPKHYGATPHAAAQIFEPARDNFELELLTRVIRDKRPFLGICRGLQILAVHSGGALIQHLPDVVPTEQHDRTYNELFSDPGHKITIEPNTKLRAIVGVDRGLVCSAHHQAIATLGAGFQVSARSSGGVIEAIESTDPEHFCIAVQSHPEAEQDGLFEKLFTAFRAACVEYDQKISR